MVLATSQGKCRVYVSRWFPVSTASGVTLGHTGAYSVSRLSSPRVRDTPRESATSDTRERDRTSRPAAAPCGQRAAPRHFRWFSPHLKVNVECMSQGGSPYRRRPVLLSATRAHIPSLGCPVLACATRRARARHPTRASATGRPGQRQRHVGSAQAHATRLFVESKV